MNSAAFIVTTIITVAAALAAATLRNLMHAALSVAVAVFGSLTWSILKTQSLAIEAPHIAMLTVKRIGAALMTTYVWPLQCVGILLTAALIAALILVMEEKR